MNIDEAKKITISLIDTFHSAGKLALSIREKGLKKKLNLITLQLLMVILR